MSVAESSRPVRLSENLTGLSFVVSGIFNRFTRDSIKEAIEANGGKIQSGISAKTSFMVAGAESGPSKLEKAAKLGVAVIDEDQLIQMIEHGQG